jgi:hypothetical protein
MNRDDQLFCLTLLGTIFSALAFFFSVLIYRRSRVRRLSISSCITLVNSKPAAVVKVTNLSQAQVVVEKIAFPLTVWDNSPSLRVPGALKALRVIEIVTNDEAFMRFVSDSAVISTSASLPGTLTEHQSLTVVFDLDALVYGFTAEERGFSSKIEGALMLSFLRLVVHTPAGSFRALAHRDLRYYLWRKLTTRVQHDD